MHSTSIAEWVIARLTDRNRAAAIIGDLSEAESGKGKLWFWLAVTGILVRLIWLPTLALLVVFYGGIWVVSALQRVTFGVPFDSPHRAGAIWEIVLWDLILIGTVLWMGLLYGAIRYGVKDRLVHLTLVMTAILSLIICYWWDPFVVSAGSALIVAVLTVCTIRRGTRRYALVLMLFVSIGVASNLFCNCLTTVYQHLIIPGPMGDAELRTHPSIFWMPILLSLLSVWVFTSAYSWLHRRWLEKRREA